MKRVFGFACGVVAVLCALFLIAYALVEGPPLVVASVGLFLAAMGWDACRK